MEQHEFLFHSGGHRELINHAPDRPYLSRRSVVRRHAVRICAQGQVYGALYNAVFVGPTVYYQAIPGRALLAVCGAVVYVSDPGTLSLEDIAVGQQKLQGAGTQQHCLDLRLDAEPLKVE